MRRKAVRRALCGVALFLSAVLVVYRIAGVEILRVQLILRQAEGFAEQ